MKYYLILWLAGRAVYSIGSWPIRHPRGAGA
jgi:hypothetical protein